MSLPTCTEACEQLGPLGPAFVLGLVALLNWLRAREAKRAADAAARESIASQIEAAKHAARADQLQNEVASLRPKSNPEIAPVVIPANPVPVDMAGEPVPLDLETADTVPPRTRQKEK